MSWVKEITTNIKSPDGNSRTYELGKYTLLVGPNESGKSAIAEAVQLALTGSAFGMLYRNKPIKAGNQLSVLKPEGTEVVYSQAVLDDGGTAEWTLEEGKRPVRKGIEGYALPMNDIRSVMAGSDSTIRSFFYDHMIGESLAEDVQAQLPESLWGDFDACVGRSESISVTKLIASLGKQKREESAKMKAASSILQYMNPTAVSESHISTLWLQLAEAQRLERLKEMYRTYRAEGGGGEASNRALSKIKASLSAIGSKDKIQNMIGSEEAREKLEEAYRERGSYQAALGMKVLVDKCETDIENISKMEKALQAAIGRLLTEKNVWSTYAAKVNMFLPNKDQFKVIDNGSVTMGLARENGLHIALSGSTEARTLAAMSAAFVASKRGRGQEEENYPAVIVVDDRMWDTATLAKTMKGLEKVDCQVIVMTTQRPRGRQREAWTYVELEK